MKLEVEINKFEHGVLLNILRSTLATKRATADALREGGYQISEANRLTQECAMLDEKIVTPLERLFR